MTTSKRLYWGEIVVRHQPAIAGFIRRRLKGSPDALDLTQEVYLRFLRADQAEVIRNPEAYLYTVALNLIREHTVLQRRWIRESGDNSGNEQTFTDYRTPDDTLDGDARRERLLELVRQLPPKSRAALTLQYQYDLSYAEIAEKMGVTTHAVKKYVMKGLALCRNRLKLERHEA
jgi:RNA polymerase sigma factor (sigma-70 family)